MNDPAVSPSVILPSGSSPLRARRTGKAFALFVALLLGGPQAFAEEAELTGFIIDNTISRSGQEFYRKFSERLHNTSDLDFNLAVRERPSARWGILIWVEMDNQPLYRRFLQPNVADMQQTAYEAADSVMQEIDRRKIEALFEDTTDLARDEL